MRGRERQNVGQKKEMREREKGELIWKQKYRVDER